MDSRRIIKPITAFGLLLVASCASHNTVAEGYLAPFRAGDFQTAAATSTEIAQDSADRNSILYLLENATALRVAGNYDLSNAAFERAYDAIEEIGKVRGSDRCCRGYLYPTRRTNQRYPGRTDSPGAVEWAGFENKR